MFHYKCCSLFRQLNFHLRIRWNVTVNWMLSQKVEIALLALGQRQLQYGRRARCWNWVRITFVYTTGFAVCRQTTKLLTTESLAWMVSQKTCKIYFNTLRRKKFCASLHHYFFSSFCIFHYWLFLIKPFSSCSWASIRNCILQQRCVEFSAVVGWVEVTFILLFSINFKNVS